MAFLHLDPSIYFSVQQVTNVFFSFFFFAVYLTLALNSFVKIYGLIHANKKYIYHINIVKYTIEITKLQLDTFYIFYT